MTQTLIQLIGQIGIISAIVGFYSLGMQLLSILIEEVSFFRGVSLMFRAVLSGQDNLPYAISLVLGGAAVLALSIIADILLNEKP